MNTKIWQSIENYLKQRQIEYVPYICDGLQSLCPVFSGYENVPSRVLEGSIFFYSDGLEWRTYYDKTAAEICARSKYRKELFELLNYINAVVWPRGEGDLTYLYAPKIYMTQDGGFDITMTAVIPYVFYNDAPLETCAFFTETIPEVLNALGMPIFSLLGGKVSVDEAKSLIENNA